MKRSLALLWPLLLGFGTSACQTLPEIATGQCGNLIVETRSDGPYEDCDGDVLPAALEGGTNIKCGSPGAANACRLDCSDPAAVCPTGYVCGGDRICRKPSGVFELLASLPASPSRLVMGDFDGDGRSDLLTLDSDSGEVGAFFFEKTGSVARSFSTPSDGMMPAVGHLLSGDPTVSAYGEDFTLAVQKGMGVMRGQPDRSFSPATYASIAPGFTDTTVLTADLMPPGPSGTSGAGAGDEVLVIHQNLMGVGAGKWFGYIADQELGDVTRRLLMPIDGPWAGPLPVARFNEDQLHAPCKDVLLVPATGNVLQPIQPCYRLDGMMYAQWNNNGKDDLAPVVTLPKLTVPGVAKVTRVIAVQLNLASIGANPVDGHVDLLIEGDDGAGAKVYVAYGLGDGSFNSTPPVTNAVPPAQNTVADNQATLAPWMPVMPLAVGDLNKDGLPDLVQADGVHLASIQPAAPPLPATLAYGAKPSTPIPQLSTASTSAWGAAQIVDYNGDGAPDVVAASTAEGIYLLSNAGQGIFNIEIVSTERAVSNLAVGDFDGDLNRDIVFSQPSGDGSGDGLFIMYGRSGEPPLTPQLFGQLGGVDALISGVDIVDRGYSSAFSDLIALTPDAMHPGGNAVALFPGRPDRLLQSPFLFRAGKDQMPSQVQIVASAIAAFHTPLKAPREDAQLGDVAVLTVEGGLAAATCSADARLWLMRSDGSAQFPSLLPPATGLCAANDKLAGVDWQSAVLVAGDIDPAPSDGRAELLILAPNKGAGTSDRGVLLVARSDESAFTVGEPLFLAEGPPQAGPQAGPFCLKDIDGDGLPDVVAVTLDDNSVPRLSVLWGKKGAAMPFESTLVPVALPELAGEIVASIACFDADGDAYPDVIVVTSGGTHLVPGHTRTLTGKKVHDADQLALPGGQSVVHGDIDDDHIPDLVVSGSSGIRIYLGKAKNP
jgi:hypothetical protein